MIKFGPDYSKLKTNLQLASTRLHLLQLNKSEKNERLKAEIRNYAENGKYMQARIKVQMIIKNEASIEAMEMLEMYCKELSEKYKLFEQRKKPDSTLINAISSIIWVAPVFQTEVPELKKIAKQLSIKYGPTFKKEVFKNDNEMVDSELRKRVTMPMLSDEKIEHYLKEICFKYGIMYNTEEDLNCKFYVDKRDENEISPMPNQKKEHAEQISKETEFSTDDNVKSDRNTSKKKSFFNNLKTKFVKSPKPSSNKSASNTFIKHKNFSSALTEKENYDTDSLGFSFDNDKYQIYKVKNIDSSNFCELCIQPDWKLREDGFTPTAPPSQVYIPIYPEPPPPYNYQSLNDPANRRSNFNQITNKCFDPPQSPARPSENLDSDNSSSEDDVSVNVQKKEES